MQIHLDLTLTHAQTLLDIRITQALNVSENDDTPERFFQTLYGELQLPLEFFAIDFGPRIKILALLVDLGVSIQLRIAGFRLAHLVDDRVMSNPHQPAAYLAVVYLAPVLPELDEYLLGNIFGIFPGAQTIVGKGINPLPVLFDDLLIFIQHL